MARRAVGHLLLGLVIELNSERNQSLGHQSREWEASMAVMMNKPESIPRGFYSVTRPAVLPPISVTRQWSASVRKSRKLLRYRPGDVKVFLRYQHSDTDASRLNHEQAELNSSARPYCALPGRERGQDGWLEITGKTRKRRRGHFTSTKCKQTIKSTGSTRP
jgi:hypothetical protein